MATVKLTPKQWEDAYDKWVLVFRPKGEITQYKYAESLGVSDTHLATMFNKIKREREMTEIKGRMPEILKKALEGVDAGLEQCEPKDLARVSNEVFKTFGDRLGLAPKDNPIQVQNNISLGVVMFSKEDEPTIKEMFTGAIIDDTSDSN